MDATLLAYAGLKRLGLAHRATTILEIDDFLPAVGQGAIAVTARTNRYGDASSAGPDPRCGNRTCPVAERAFLGVLDGSCRTPIAGHAHIVSGEARVPWHGISRRRFRVLRGTGDRDYRRRTAASAPTRGANYSHVFPPASSPDPSRLAFADFVDLQYRWTGCRISRSATTTADAASEVAASAPTCAAREGSRANTGPPTMIRIRWVR